MLPMSAELGVTEVSVTSGRVTPTSSLLLVPPPGAGVTTCTDPTYPPTRKLQVVPPAIVARRVPASTYVVGTAEPCHVMCDAGTKLAPETVSVTFVDPATIVAGETLVMVGTAAVMVSVWLAVVPPPGPAVRMVIAAVAGERSDAPGITPTMVVLSVKLVATGVPLNKMVDGVALLTNPLPVMVMVRSPLPIPIEAGLMAVSVGEGFVMVRVTGSEVAAPGAGFTTVTEMLPASVHVLAGRAVRRVVASTYSVVTAPPFTAMVASVRNPVPESVRTCEPLPTAIDVGE